jgi:hypothetical protein
MNDWNIQSRAHQCMDCGRSFQDKETYRTLLLDEKQAYVRKDVCEGCWKDQYSQGAQERKGFVSCWQGVYEVPPAAPPEPIQKETAESLLRKLIERNEPQYAAAAFILAVMLERKRVLKVKEQLRDGGRRVFLYEQPKTGDLFTIPDPQLQLNQLEQVQHDVADLLEHGLRDEAVPTGPGPGPALQPAAGGEAATPEPSAAASGPEPVEAPAQTAAQAG